MGYLPSKEMDLAGWVLNFAQLIAASPSTYGLMVSDATEITLVQNNFAVALALATNPGTKTRASVTDKDAKKATMLAVIRPYAQTIKRNLGISNLVKANLGLTIDATTNTPVPAPTTFPILAVTAIQSLRHILRFSDSASPDKRGKPKGAERMQLFRYVGTTPPASTDQMAFVADITKQPVTVSQASGDAGKFAYYAARWATRTGLTGPFSAVISAAIIA